VCLTDSDEAFAARGCAILALALEGCEADRGAFVCWLIVLTWSHFASWRKLQMRILGAHISRVWAEVGSSALVPLEHSLSISILGLARVLCQRASWAIR